MARWIDRHGVGVCVAAVLAVASGPLRAQPALASNASAGSSALATLERQNWFNDPFFALSNTFADCPVPLGPLMTHAQMEDDAHYRVERGTTCWLAHKCTKPNSYLYDAPIAAAIHAHFTDPQRFDGTSLWITVQRRFVYAEGCAPASFDREALRRQLEAIPDVEQVFVRLSPGAHGPLPYKTLVAPDRPVAPDAAQ